MIVWDTGTYENINEHDGQPISMADAFDKGHIKINLNGKKLHGGYALTKFKDNDWLLVKMDDDYADARRNPVKTEPASVLSDTTIKKLDNDYNDEKKKKKA